MNEVEPTAPREPVILPLVREWKTTGVVAEKWVFTHDNIKEAHEIQDDMHATLMHNDLPGLAHTHVGGNKRIICLRSLGCMFNPRVVFKGEEEHVLEEASVSFPGLQIKIKRPFAIRVRFEIVDGRTFTEPYNGITARQVLHLIDHLDGVPFYSSASRFHREQAFNKQKRFLRHNVRA